MTKFNVLIEKGEDGYFLGEVLEFRGARTQAKTKKELLENLREVIELNIEMKTELESGTFLGVEQLEIKA